MSYYNDFLTPDGASPLCDNPSDETKDLLRGVAVYGVEMEAPVDEVFRSPQFNTQEECFTLTDGSTVKELDYQDPALTRFTRGNSRIVIYRLPFLSAVSGFSMGFLHQKKAMGVRLPERFDISVSLDGKEWRRVYKHRGVPNAADPSLWTVKGDFDAVYKASWIRLELGTLTHIWAEHLSVFGTTLIPETAVIPVSDGSLEERRALCVDKYPSFDVLNGVHNIFLAYNCFPPETNEARKRVENFSVEEMRPYVGYYNKDGKLEDTFFDGVLFLPYSAYTYSKYYKCADGWRRYLDSTFAPDLNVDAINKAAMMTEKELNRECKVNVFLSIFHTSPSYGDFPEKFGDLDGDGVDEELNNAENKKKMIKWMIDEYIKRFDEGGYKNLVLNGFYWFEEQIDYYNPDEFELLFFARDYVHSMGYKFIWIPYYQAAGFCNWKELGFDIACMQPNYAFHDDMPVERLYLNADLTKKYGMCYELEIDQVGRYPDSDRYKQYLEVGIKTGFMDTVKMYYQECRAFYYAYKSDDAFIRSVYDDTYLFAKEKLVRPIRAKDITE